MNLLYTNPHRIGKAEMERELAEANAADNALDVVQDEFDAMQELLIDNNNNIDRNEFMRCDARTNPSPHHHP